MQLEIKPGRDNPVADGRYLVFTTDDVKPEYARPLVLTWHGGQWNYPNSSILYGRPVFGYAGPLPIGKLADIFPTCVAHSYFDEFTPMAELPSERAMSEASNDPRWPKRDETSPAAMTFEERFPDATEYDL